MIPGNTAFPCKHSYLADSQASTLGFPVKPAELMTCVASEFFKKTPKSMGQEASISDLKHSEKLILKARKKFFMALPTNPLDPIITTFKGVKTMIHVVYYLLCPMSEFICF